MKEFLLDATPFLAEYAGLTKQHRSKTDITKEFQRQFNCTEHEKIAIVREPTHFERCPRCNTRNGWVDASRDAANICTVCGYVASYFIPDGTKGLTHEQRLHLPPAPYTYKPLAHFSDLINNVEAKSSSHKIPQILIKELQAQFKLMEVDFRRITPKDVRLRLREIKAGHIYDGGNRPIRGCQYYEDIHFITRILNPTYKKVQIPEQRKTILKSMFREVYPRFHANARAIQPKRKNFLSYPYVAYKFCELCGWHEYMHLFPLLKSREKLRVQDAILKRIFDELDWDWENTI